MFILLSLSVVWGGGGLCNEHFFKLMYNMGVRL